MFATCNSPRMMLYLRQVEDERRARESVRAQYVSAERRAAAVSGELEEVTVEKSPCKFGKHFVRLKQAWKAPSEHEN